MFIFFSQNINLVAIARVILTSFNFYIRKEGSKTEVNKNDAESTTSSTNSSQVTNCQATLECPTAQASDFMCMYSKFGILNQLIRVKLPP